MSLKRRCTWVGNQFFPLFIFTVVFLMVFYNIRFSNYATSDKLFHDTEELKFKKDIINVKPNIKVKDTLNKKHKMIHDSNGPVPICTKNERIELLHEKCHGLNVNTELSSMERMWISNNIFVDLQHKVLACIPPKSGCTTWKSILANNSENGPLPDAYNVMKLHFGKLKDFNIYSLARFNRTFQQQLLTSGEYYKFMIARHPFERLYSGYMNKLVSGIDRMMQKKHGYRILTMFHPKLPENERRNGLGVRFNEFVKYLKAPQSRNPHWEPIYNLCQPCKVRYNQVIKTETLDEDNVDIIKTYFGPHHRGIGTKGNVVAGGRQLSSLTRKGRKIDVFEDLDKTDLKYLLQRFSNDMAMFGYNWTLDTPNRNSTIHTACVNGAKNKMCC